MGLKAVHSWKSEDLKTHFFIDVIVTADYNKRQVKQY